MILCFVMMLLLSASSIALTWSTGTWVVMCGLASVEFLVRMVKVISEAGKNNS